MFTKSIVKKALAVRCFANSTNNFVPAKLPDLPYDYGELEPSISAQIMKLHHDKHHKTYVDNYNKFVEQFLDATAKGDHEKSSSLLQLIRFNGGGHINHSIFWQNLAPKGKGGGEVPDSQSEFGKAITKQFGGIEDLKKKMSDQAAGLQVRSLRIFR